jgi:hypothetical protein
MIYLDLDLLRRLLDLDGERDFLRDGDLLYPKNENLYLGPVTPYRIHLSQHRV